MAQLLDVAATEQIDDVVLVPTGSVIRTSPVVIVTAKTDAANVQVDASDVTRTPVEFRTLSGGRYLFSKPGKVWVDVTAIDFAANIYAKKTIVVEVGSSPTPPTPPGPGPTPPTPPRPDGEPPIAGEGLRVLFVYESSQALPAALQQVFYGPEIRSYLNANAAKVDGHSDWRIVDKDTKFTDANHRFAKALARPRASVPWLIISNGSAGYEGPFPGGVAETLALIKSYAPSQVNERGSVVLYTVPNCLWCDKWQSMELQPMLDLSSVDYRAVQDDRRQFDKHPTFVLSKNGKSVTLTGYQPAATIIAEIGKL